MNAHLKSETYVCVGETFQAMGTVCCRNLDIKIRVCSKNFKNLYEWSLTDKVESGEMTVEKSAVAIKSGPVKPIKNFEL